MFSHDWLLDAHQGLYERSLHRNGTAAIPKITNKIFCSRRSGLNGLTKYLFYQLQHIKQRKHSLFLVPSIYSLTSEYLVPNIGMAV